jgi:branched-chain amino acid transport system ATP-binding protein
MAIAHDPTVLLLDEPSSGIAQRETEALGPLLKRIQHEAGCALLIIEHDMPLISSISDQIIALDLGAVILQGTPEEVLTDPHVVSSYLGGDLTVINRSGEVEQPKETAPAAAARPTRRQQLRARP